MPGSVSGMGQGTGAPAQPGPGGGVLRHPLPFPLPLPSPPPIRSPSPAPPTPRQLGRRKLLPKGPWDPGAHSRARSLQAASSAFLTSRPGSLGSLSNETNEAGFFSLRLGFLSRRSAHGFLIPFRRPEPDPLRLRGKPCAPARLPPLPETPRTTLSHSAPGGLLGAARPLAPAAFPGASRGPRPPEALTPPGQPASVRPRQRVGSSPRVRVQTGTQSKNRGRRGALTVKHGFCLFVFLTTSRKKGNLSDNRRGRKREDTSEL